MSDKIGRYSYSESNREKGDEFTREMVALFQRYFPAARETVGSGSKYNDGDILGVPDCFIDTKTYKTESISIKKKDWEKTCDQADTLVPILIVENKDGTSLAVLSVEDLAGYIKASQQVSE